PDAAPLPEPTLPAIAQTYGIIVTGVGGTGIVTIGGVLGMAANLEGKGVGIIDMAGLAQKGGAVYSHIRIANRPEDIHAIRIAAAALEKAIELNGEAVAMNQQAFRWGRLAAIDPAAVEALVAPATANALGSRQLSESFDEMVARRADFLTAYQNAAYAGRYRAWVEKVRGAEAAKAAGKSGLAEAVARYLFKLMA